MNSKEVGRPIRVLFVEDDPGDAELMQEVIKEEKIRVRMDRVDDGEKAMAFLRKEGDYADIPRPDLILLDLNMPRKNGIEVLREVKEDPALKSIPVVILTTSQTEEDIIKTYTLGASCYISKPVGLEQFAKVVASIDNFWFTLVKYPPAG